VYLDCLESNPLITKILTTAFLVGGGDVIAQLFIEKNSSLDPHRSMKMLIFGGCIVGPSLHFWYNFLNRTFTVAGTSGALQRLACDQGIFAPTFIVIAFTFMLGMDGRIHDVPVHLKEHWWPTTVTNWVLWIPTMFLVFRFVPLSLQVLVVNGVALIWNTYLSFVGHKK